MIEMRWLMPVETKVRLQYRRKVDTNVYAGESPFPGTLFRPNLQWSDWCDVPYVAEDTGVKE